MQTIFFLFIFLMSLAAFSFTDEEFEKIVLSENAEIEALYNRKQALQQNIEEAELIYGWQVTGGLNRRIDKRPSAIPNFTYDKLSTTSAEVGLQKNFSFGLEGKILLRSTETEIKNGNSGSGPFETKIWESQPTLELKFPLLAGRFGKKIQADYQAAIAAKSLEALNAEMEYDEKLNIAKNLFWSTVLQKELLVSQNESLRRIQAIYKIVQSKKAQNLEASSNYLQTRSALEQTELELQQAKLKYTSLERLLKLVLAKFGSALKIPSYDFNKFEKVKLSDLSGKINPTEKMRITSEELKLQSALSASEERISRLDLFAATSLSGTSKTWSESFSESKNDRYSTNTIGVTWTTPLDFGITSRLVNRQQILAQSANIKKKYFLDVQTPELLQDLISQFHQLNQILLTNLKLEKTQLEKVKNERALLTQGRSSIYQVLQFELDLSRAQSGKYLIALDLEKLHQQLSQYRYNSNE